MQLRTTEPSINNHIKDWDSASIQITVCTGELSLTSVSNQWKCVFILEYRRDDAVHMSVLDYIKLLLMIIIILTVFIQHFFKHTVLKCCTIKSKQEQQ